MEPQIIKDYIGIWYNIYNIELLKNKRKEEYLEIFIKYYKIN